MRGMTRRVVVYLAGLLGAAVGMAGGGQVYYSIHLASFQSLENANGFVNSLQTKGKIVFWQETDVPGKGLYYRVYLGKYANRDEAVAFWHSLKAENAVSYFGVHAFQQAPEPAPAELPPVPPEPLPAPAPLPALQPDQRVIDNNDGTITDTATRLMWLKNGWRFEFLSALNFVEAQQRCQSLDSANPGAWRLPTLDEWQTIIDRRYQNPALVEPNPFVNIIGHMPYWTQTDYTYGQANALRSRSAMEAYTVMLYSGSVHHQRKTERAFVLPVRSIEQN